MKKAFGGYYPSFWYPAILKSGLARRVMARFGSSPDLVAITGSGERIKIKQDF